MKKLIWLCILFSFTPSVYAYEIDGIPLTGINPDRFNEIFLQSNNAQIIYDESDSLIPVNGTYTFTYTIQPYKIVYLHAFYAGCTGEAECHLLFNNVKKFKGYISPDKYEYSKEFLIGIKIETQAELIPITIEIVNISSSSQRCWGELLITEKL